MKDNNPKTNNELETKVNTLEKQRTEKRQDEKEIREAKSSIGIEAGEIIEGAEVSSGEITETEKGKKESDTGGTTSGKTVRQTEQIAKPTYPSVKRMTANVEKELKKEIKDLHKKIKSVMKRSGNLDAAQLNILMAKLRQLKETLASLAYATADIIRDMWRKHVKERK